MTSCAKVLIVDDDPTSIQVLFAALEGSAEVRFATSGADALASLADDPPDLVLLDASMPGLSGYSTCRALRQVLPDLPVIFITASSDLASELRALEAGAVDFITKPINPPLVRARVEVQLTLKEQRDLLRAREASVRAALGENERLVAELRSALDQVRTLSGFLPLCMYCKKVRDDQGYWARVETYITEHTDALVSHGMCPDCMKRLMEAEGMEVPPPETPLQEPERPRGPAPRRASLAEAFRVTFHGTGPRTVLLANGFGTTQEVWSHQVAALKERFRVVTFDHAGATPATAPLYQASRHKGLFGFAEDLVRLVEGLGLEGATFVGHSMSGMIGLLAACAAPGLFERLVLIAASARYLDDPSRAYVGGFSKPQLEEILGSMDRDYAAWANGFSAAAMGNPERPDLSASFARSLKSLYPETALAIFGAVMGSDHRAGAERYRKLGLPTLLLQTREDPAVPRAAADWLARATGGELRVLDAEGHFPHLAAPAAVTREILAFLERP